MKKVLTIKTLEELKNLLEPKYKIYGNLKSNNNTFDVITTEADIPIAGLVYYCLGPKTQKLFLNNCNNVFFGVNRHLVCMNYQNNKQIFEKTLPSILCEIINIKKQNLVVCLCELDLMVFSDYGNLKWSTGFRDIVINYNIIDNTLMKIHCANGDKLKLCLTTGNSL